MSGLHPITIRVVRTVSGTGRKKKTTGCGRPVIRVGVGYKKKRATKGGSWILTGSKSGKGVKYHSIRI